MDKLLEKVKFKYEVKCFTDYHWRINGFLDIYPTTKEFLNIKNKTNGTYIDLMEFLESYVEKDKETICQIKTFEGEDLIALQVQVNDWISEYNIFVVDIKYQVNVIQGNFITYYYSILVMYEDGKN